MDIIQDGNITHVLSAGRTLPLDDLFEVKDFLEEKYVILHPDDPEIKRRGDFVLFRGKVYKIEMISLLLASLSNLLALRLVEDELAADILKASIE